MADGIALGFDFSGVQKTIEDVDKRLVLLANHSEETSKRVNKALSDMGKVNLNMSSVNDMGSTLLELGKRLKEINAEAKKNQGNPTILERLNKDGSSTIDKINEVFVALEKVRKASLDTDGLKLSQLRAAYEKVNAQFKAGGTYWDSPSNMLPGGASKSGFVPFTNKEMQRITDERAALKSLIKLREKSTREKLDDAAKGAERELKIEEKKNKAILEDYKRQSKRRRELYEKYIRTYEGAVRKSDRAKSLNDEKEAINLLTAARDNLSKSTKDYSKKLDELNTRINAHRISVETSTKTQEQQKTLLPSVRLEYERMLKELDSLSKAYEKVRLAQQRNPLNPNLETQKQAILNRIKDVDDARIKLEQSAQGKLTRVARKHAADRAKIEIEEFVRAEKEKLRKSAELDSNFRKRRYNQYITSYEGSLRTSEKARNVLQQEQAVKNLLAARDKLMKTDVNYQAKLKRLNEEIAKNRYEIDKVRGKSDELAKSHRHLMDISGQLARKLALVFSVSQITGYVNKLAKVRGEFELQQRSIEAILQNKSQADVLWNRTVELAVRSPFRVKELVTYTKQLAAYRVEADKLYSTNKMLADVSAGLGVSMDRLILAYGQVKAANYLRGTELRQFSEAGVNVLGELAKQFSEVEGRAVSVGEVFERVSKRLVTFEDVEKVFKRITAEGGVFYNMQEIQAETLKGQISNLYDSIDLMLNKIGESNDGALKGGVRLARAFVENWEAVASAIKTVVISLTAYKATSLFVAFATQSRVKALRELSLIQEKSIKQTHLWGKAWDIAKIKMRGFWLTMRKGLASSGYALAFAALIAGIHELFTWNDELNDKLKEINKTRNEELAKINKLTLAYRDLQRAERGGKVDNFDEKKDKLSELIAYAKDKGINIPIKVEDLKKEEIDKVFANVQSQLNNTANLIANFKSRWAEGGTEAEGWFGIFGYNLETNISQANEAVGELMSDKSRARFEEFFNNLLANYSHLSKAEQEYVDLLRNGKDELETDSEFFMRRLQLLFQYTRKKGGVFEGYWASGVHNIFERLQKYNTRAAESFREIDKVIKDFLLANGTTLDKMTEDQKLQLGVEIDTFLASQQLNQFYEDKVREYIHKEIKIPVRIVTEEEGFKEDWQKRLRDKLMQNVTPDGLTELGRKIKNLGINFSESSYKDKTYEQTANTVKSLYEVAKKDKEIYELNKDNVKVTKEEYELRLKQIPVLKELASLLGIDLDKKTRGKEQKEALRKLKEQIQVIKDAYKEYTEVRKNFGKEYTESQLSESYGDTFRKALLGDVLTYDFSSKRGLLEALDRLTAKAKAAGGELELLKEKSKIRMEIELEDDKSVTEKLSNDIENMFGDYEVSLELEKLNIPPEIGKRLFGLDAMSLDEIKAKMADMEPLFDGKEDYKKFQEYVKKREELEDKARVERLKKYTKYLAEAQSERIKIKLEELRKLEEVEKESRYNEGDRSDINSAIRKEAEKKMQELEWKEFKESDMYLRIFEDLDNMSEEVLDKMEQRLNGLKNSLKDLSPSELKEIMSSIEKIQDAKFEQKNIFEQLIDSAKRFRKLAKETDKDELEKAYVNSEDDKLFKKREVEWLEKQVATSDHYYKIAVKSYGIDSEQAKKAKEVLETNKKNLRVKLAELEAQGKISAELAKQLREWADAEEDLGKSVSGVADKFAQAFDALPQVAGDLEHIFGNMDAKTKDIVDSVSAIGGGTAKAVSQFASQDYIGGVVSAIGVVSQIFQIGDKKKERKIQREIKFVEELQRQYEKLGESIEKAYSIDTLNKSMQLSDKNIREQIDARKEMIRLEEDKKKTDHDRIKQWNQEIEDLQKQQEELHKQQVENMGGTYDYKSAAEGFINAWLDAFEETGDGLDGLKGHFKEFASELLLKQAVMTGAANIIEPLESMITDALKNDYTIDDIEWNNIDNIQSEQLKKLDEFLRGFYGKYEGILGGSESMSGLQRGIQEITESTAQIIEAYLNSIRLYVSDTNNKFTRFLDGYMNTESENPMISQLRIIARQTTSINLLLDSVVKTGPGQGGAGIKVFMD